MLPVVVSTSLQHAGSRATASNTALGRTGPPRVNMSMRTPILLMMPRRSGFPRAFNRCFSHAELLNWAPVLRRYDERRTFESLAAIRVCTGCCREVCSLSAAIFKRCADQMCLSDWAAAPRAGRVAEKDKNPEASLQWSKTVVSTTRAVLFLPSRT